MNKRNTITVQALCLLFSLFAIGAGPTLIHLGTLQDSINANGNSITNAATITAMNFIGNGAGLTNLPGGGGSAPWLREATNFTAVAGGKYQVDTSGGAVIVTLPATMTAMDRIDLEDLKLSWGTNNVTLARNGNKINGGTSNYVDGVIGDKLGATAADSGTNYGWSVK